MNQKSLRTIALRSFVLVAALGAAWQTRAQHPKTSYPSMAPLDQYLIADANAEMVLARSAAPDSISGDAEVMVLGRRGYETVVKGKNGFVCMVQRSWAAGIDDPDFWNPKLRSPVCFNAPAARSFLPLIIKRTELILAGRSKDQMFAAIQAAIDKKKLTTNEFGAMGYMISKQWYLSELGGLWLPPLRFFLPLTEQKTSGGEASAHHGRSSTLVLTSCSTSRRTPA